MNSRTYGFFFPYILEAVGNTSDRANYTLQAIWFVSTALAVGTIYMPLIDRVSGRKMLLWSSVLQVAGFVPFIFFEVSFTTALINVVLFGIGAGIGQQSLFQLWSGELFPTLLRSTAQGFMFGVVRIALGGWSLLLPTVQQAGFRTLAIVLALMLIVSGVVGILFAPRTGARELDDDEPSGRFGREPGAVPVRWREQCPEHPRAAAAVGDDRRRQPSVQADVQAAVAHVAAAWTRCWSWTSRHSTCSAPERVERAWDPLRAHLGPASVRAGALGGRWSGRSPTCSRSTSAPWDCAARAANAEPPTRAVAAVGISRTRTPDANLYTSTSEGVGGDGRVQGLKSLSVAVATFGCWRPLRRCRLTSLGEHWAADSRSRNHHFFGAIVQWFYEELAGIRPLDARATATIEYPAARSRSRALARRQGDLRQRARQDRLELAEGAPELATRRARRAGRCDRPRPCACGASA